MTLRWMKAATRERMAQLDFIALDKPSAAIKMDEEIERQTEMLVSYPLMGRVGRVEGTRELVISRSPFIAVYRIKDQRIEILRFLRGAEQWPKP